MSDEQRKDVVAEARSWLETPYHHAADVKGHGVDCAMLLVRVYCDLRLVERSILGPTLATGSCIGTRSVILASCLSAHERYARQVGDIILFRVGRCFAHAGIVSSVAPLPIIHAFFQIPDAWSRISSKAIPN